MKMVGRAFCVAAVASLATAGTALAGPPEPDHHHPSCHGLAMAQGAMGVGVGNVAKDLGIPAVDVHYVFTDRWCVHH